MSFIYGVGLPGEIDPATPNIDAAQNFAQALITLGNYQTQFLTLLNSIVFTSYDDRRHFIRSFNRFTASPIITFTGSFDPIQYPLVPPFAQTRFPARGSYISLYTSPVLAPLTAARRALSINDSDPNFSVHQDNFETARGQLNALATDPLAIINRFTFETRFLLVWSLWPDIPPCPTPSQSLPPPTQDSLSSSPVNPGSRSNNSATFTDS